MGWIHESKRKSAGFHKWHIAWRKFIGTTCVSLGLKGKFIGDVHQLSGEIQERRGKRTLRCLLSVKKNTVLLGSKEWIGQPLKLKGIETARQNKRTWSIEEWPDGKEYVIGASGKFIEY